MNNITEIMNSESLTRCIKRIAHEILEKNDGTKNIILVGIKRRGIPLAERIANFIDQIESVKVPVCSLDISFYRDDLSKISEEPTVKQTNLDFNIDNKIVILVDDVLYTGRTARAAIDALFDNARPRMIQLAVIVDRGHREIPIRADYVGKNVPTSKEEHISVCVNEIDCTDSVLLVKNS